jgi:hypothetical protein
VKGSDGCNLFSVGFLAPTQNRHLFPSAFPLPNPHFSSSIFINYGLLSVGVTVTASKYNMVIPGGIILIPNGFNNESICESANIGDVRIIP